MNIQVKYLRKLKSNLMHKGSYFKILMLFLKYLCSEPLRSDRRNLTRRFRALSYRR
jgi:hypothetical protein